MDAGSAHTRQDLPHKACAREPWTRNRVATDTTLVSCLSQPNAGSRDG